MWKSIPATASLQIKCRARYAWSMHRLLICNTSAYVRMWQDGGSEFLRSGICLLFGSCVEWLRGCVGAEANHQPWIDSAHIPRDRETTYPISSSYANCNTLADVWNYLTPHASDFRSSISRELVIDIVALFRLGLMICFEDFDIRISSFNKIRRSKNIFVQMTNLSKNSKKRY